MSAWLNDRAPDLSLRGLRFILFCKAKSWSGSCFVTAVRQGCASPLAETRPLA